MELHKGEIYLKSEVGKGSSFFLAFPKTGLKYKRGSFLSLCKSKPKHVKDFRFLKPNALSFREISYSARYVMISFKKAVNPPYQAAGSKSTIAKVEM